MTALVLSLLSSPTLLAIMAGIIGALGWGFKQRLTGARLEREKQAKAEQKARDVADEVQSDVGAMSPDQVRAELAKRTRP
ncbi:hypothetical protein IG197_27760 [Aminobacter sp. SR38]|jgi:hypothetical protein|uniref:hypothetical protein n=1 Tax=Aminobacter sp. SR38 TaxID=2774562 RepID=UPI00177ED637|nr:hypothetical protein [Aminobacter sp. SR38]QOF71490.1 hypothetical protein IG197_27760 [Aminobacter sp. SR38]